MPLWSKALIEEQRKIANNIEALPQDLQNILTDMYTGLEKNRRMNAHIKARREEIAEAYRPFLQRVPPLTQQQFQQNWDRILADLFPNENLTE